MQQNVFGNFLAKLLAEGGVTSNILQHTLLKRFLSLEPFTTHTHTYTHARHNPVMVISHNFDGLISFGPDRADSEKCGFLFFACKQLFALVGVSFSFLSFCSFFRCLKQRSWDIEAIPKRIVQETFSHIFQERCFVLRSVPGWGQVAMETNVCADHVLSPGALCDL